MKKATLGLRLGLFMVILGLGVLTALVVGETAGLALADLSDASIEALTESAQSDILYAALDEKERPQGFYRSEDGGRSWQMVSPGPEGVIKTLAVDPTDDHLLYASTVGGPEPTQSRLWYSQNQGQTWQQYELTLPVNTDDQFSKVTELAISPHDPRVLYVGTEGQGLYRVWVEEGRYELIGDRALPGLYINDIVAASDGQVYILTTAALSVIEGDTWREITSLPDLAVSLAVDPTNPQTLYAGTVAYGTYRSDDRGQSWQPINDGLGWRSGVILRISDIAIDEDNVQHLALATAHGVGDQLVADGIYESFNGGQSWTKLADIDEVINQLIIEEKGVFAVTDHGLVRYGEPWPPTSLRAWIRSYLPLDLGLQIEN